MAHVFEPSPNSRAKCRGCGARIEKGVQRFGEGVRNPFGEGDTTHWFHPFCAAYKRPEAILAGLAQEDGAGVPDRELLADMAQRTVMHRRLARIDGADRAPTAQAKCRSCREPIAKGSWRIRLVFYEEGRFLPGGFLHIGCRNAYFETDDVLAPVLHFSPSLTDEERDDLARAFAENPAS